MDALEKADVESRPVWKPMHLQPIFKEYDFVSDKANLKVIDEYTGADDSVSGLLFERGVCLPSDSKMTDEDLVRICEAISDLWSML